MKRWIVNRYCSNRAADLLRDTIFAISSGHGISGVAVVRVSGPRTSTAMKLITQERKLPKARYASLRKFYQPSSGDLVDKGLLLWFPGPNSFTGEDAAELHVHGGPAVIEGILHALQEIEGVHPAEAGEFTRRAFENGKLDLTEVEGLADLIHAQTEVQRKQALRQMDGDLSRLYVNWSKSILKCVADVEAMIDFSEDVVEEGMVTRVQATVSQVAKEVRNHLQDKRRGEKLRAGVNIVIAGAPNVGKSSLLNHFCQRPAAIVSPHEGTTRDIVETTVNIGGYPVLFSDTAGIRQSIDPVEKEGIRRAKSRISAADLVLIVDDVSKWDLAASSLNYSSKLLLQTIENGRDDNHNVNNLSKADFLMVLNKVDLITNEKAARIKQILSNNMKIESRIISCSSGDGIDSLTDLLCLKLKDICGDPVGGNPSITQSRHRFHLKEALNSLENFLQIAEGFADEDFVIGAEELRIALREFGKITGHVGVEDILDVIFRDFCIGK